MARFCIYCGAQISDKARFCNKCGKAVLTAPGQPQNSGQSQNSGQPQNFGQPQNSGQSQNFGQPQNSGQPQYSGQPNPDRNPRPFPAPQPGSGQGNKVKKKHSPLFTVLIALLLVLCITVVSVGGYFLYSRFIRGGNSSKKDYEYHEFKDASYPKGNSSAFSETPVDGITISAEAGALEEDTDISFTEIEDDSYYEEYEEPLNNLGSEILVAYDLDMGLEPEETIPGYVEMSFDLKEMGIPEELWEDIEIYRQREEFDEDEPEGSFERYASKLDDKGVLTVATTKNCPILITVATYAVVSIGTLAVSFGTASAVNNYQEQMEHFDSDSSLLLKNRDKWSFDVRVNLKDTEFKNSPEGKEAIKKVKEINDYSIKLQKKAKEEYIREVNRMADDGKKGIAIVKWAQRQKRVKEIKKTLDESKFIKEYFEKDKKFKELSSELKIPESVEKTVEVINDSYEYINSQSIKLPGRAVEFDILPIGAQGLKVSSLTWPSYMQLNSRALVQNGVYNPSEIDRFRLTCTHEFFHICQEEYAPEWKRNIKEIVEDTRFEEATAGVLEKDASIWFYNKGIQTTNPDQASGLSLDYVARDQNYCYCVPLNELPKATKTDKMDDPWVDIGYTESDLIDYLRANKSMVSITALMNTYKVTKPQTRFVDILCSANTFNIDKGEEWRKLYQGFILTQVKDIINTAETGKKVFPKYFNDSEVSMSDKGDVAKWKTSDKNITAIRTLNPKIEGDKKKKYIVILETNDEFSEDKDIMLRLMNKEGEFIYKDRNYSDPVDSESMQVLYSRAYGSPDDSSPLMVYAICLFEPEAPHLSLTGAFAIVPTMKAPKKLKEEGKVTALRTVFSYKSKNVTKETPVDSDDPKNRLGEDIEMDISGLGEIRDPEELKCTQAWIYRDKKGKEYVGPEVEGIIDNDDISGTYNTSVVINDFALGDGLYTVVGGFAGGIAKMFGADPTEDQIREAVNSGVEWHVESIDYNQTVTISSLGKNKYRAEIKTDKFGDMVYSGTLTGDVLSLKLEKASMKSGGASEGIDISLEEFLGRIALTFKKDKDGEVYIDGSNDIDITMIKAVYTCKGRKEKP
ncbi:MAG: zinc-ribbon domain-containing protein [Lachnospiraceae bacterium]|nr:zinc-ribbon domain-containing protein [Lachnospiraceae bacterium]